MAEPRAEDRFSDTLRALTSWTQASGVPVLLIGGVAASMLGKPRTTKDVDAVAWLPDHEDWPAFLAAGRDYGIVPRVADPLDFALRTRVLLLRHERSAVPIDLSLGALPFEENAIRRAVAMDVGGLLVPLPTPEDLIVMKALAHRPVDAADIDAILGVHPGIDRTWVISAVREFAELLDAPELLTDLVQLLDRHAPRPRGKKRPRSKR